MFKLLRLQGLHPFMQLLGLLFQLVLIEVVNVECLAPLGQYLPLLFSLCLFLATSLGVSLLQVAAKLGAHAGKGRLLLSVLISLLLGISLFSFQPF